MPGHWKPETKSRLITLLNIELPILLGGFIRVVQVLATSFPLNDGGMFYVMVRDLQANNYRIPSFTSYNFSSIPYAYPAFSFYLAGWLNDLGLDLLQILRFYPLAFSLLAIPAFYWLASEILEERRKVTLATYAFALLKPSYEWLIMGGGLTRSPAFTFSILCLAFWARWLRGRSRRGWFWAGLCFGLIVGTHLEIALVTAASMLLFLLFYQPTWQKAGRLAGAVLIGGVVSAPYWLQVLGNHGLQPFLMALANSGYDKTTRILNLLLPSTTEESVLTLFAVLMLLGMIYLVTRRSFFLVAWWLLLVAIDPRSLERSAAILAPLLAAIGIEEVVVKGLSAVSADRWSRAVVRLVPALFVFQLLLMAVQGSLEPQTLTDNLNLQEMEAMGWAKENTPIDAVFLVLPASDTWGNDSLMEWFPALAERANRMTVQGYEWLLKREFTTRIVTYFELRACLMQPGNGCLDAYLQTHQSQYDYVFLTNDLRLSEASTGYSEYDWIERGYQVVYSKDEVVILKKPVLEMGN